MAHRHLFSEEPMYVTPTAILWLDCGTDVKRTPTTIDSQPINVCPARTAPTMLFHGDCHWSWPPGIIDHYREAVSLAIAALTVAVFAGCRCGIDISSFATSVDQSPAFAALATERMQEASLLPQKAEVACHIQKALHCVRDVAAWRIQMSVPFGSRDKFLEAATKAWKPALLDTLKLSQLMSSHRKKIFKAYRSSSFTSVNQLRPTRAARVRSGGNVP